MAFPTISISIVGPTKCDKIQMFLNGISLFNEWNIKANDYTCLLAEAMFCDLECFKYLLQLYEEVKPTIDELIESEKLGKGIHCVEILLFPFTPTGENYQLRGNLLYYLGGEESICMLECLRTCPVLDLLFDDTSLQDTTPLLTAILLDEITLAEKMVELGAPINRFCMNSDVLHNINLTPIGQAVLRGQEKLVKKMLQIGIMHFIC